MKYIKGITVLLILTLMSGINAQVNVYTAKDPLIYCVPISEAKANPGWYLDPKSGTPEAKGSISTGLVRNQGTLSTERGYHFVQQYTTETRKPSANKPGTPELQVCRIYYEIK